MLMKWSVCYKRLGSLVSHKCIDVSTKRTCTTHNPIDSSTNESEENFNIQNVSRLRNREFHLIRNQPPKGGAKYAYQEKVTYFRKLYARFGENSGVHPGIIWPTEEQLEVMKEYEQFEFQEPFLETVAKAKKKRQEEIASMWEREKEIKKKLMNLERMKRDLLARREEKFAKILAKQRERNRLIEEVREEFSQSVSVYDPKFQARVKEKEEEQKKIQRKKQKEELRILKAAQFTGLQQNSEQTVKDLSSDKAAPSEDKSA